ncbi:MAG TPA: RNA polymerase factor sigma-54, partial [Ramlibacter sp.]|nr:RNA polymerase factor sigma-54 [Ramlibacter sp.]
MKQGLSLRVSQHLALTPQLQQSIRLLQLSTMELAQEVEQMLDENPFLETAQEEPREEFGGDAPSSAVEADDDEAATSFGDAEPATFEGEAENWDGDGSTEIVPDDSEWGVDAAPRKTNAESDEDMDATELARGQESMQAHLHRQTLSLRLCEEDRCALQFLIESLNDDGYLEESLQSFAAALAPDDEEQREELVHRFTVALRLLHHLDPTGVGARSLAECLTLQLDA